MFHDRTIYNSAFEDDISCLLLVPRFLGANDCDYLFSVRWSLHVGTTAGTMTGTTTGRQRERHLKT